VERIIPVKEVQPQKSRRGIFHLKGHSLGFWFRHVHPNRSQIERGSAQSVLENQLIPEFDHFASLTLEEICQQHFLASRAIRRADLWPHQFWQLVKHMCEFVT
jgi:hypothetical protein